MQFGLFLTMRAGTALPDPAQMAVFSVTYLIVLMSRAAIFICATTQMETTGPLPGSRSAKIRTHIRACAATGRVIRYLMRTIRGSTARPSTMFRTV